MSEDLSGQNPPRVREFLAAFTDNLPQRPEDLEAEPSTVAQPSRYDAYIKSTSHGVIELTRGPRKMVWVNKNRLPQYGGTPESRVWQVLVLDTEDDEYPVEYSCVHWWAHGPTEGGPMDLSRPNGPSLYVVTDAAMTLELYP